MLGATTAYWVLRAGRCARPPSSPCTASAASTTAWSRSSRICPHMRVISPDLPGFGETPPLPATRHDIDAYAAWLREFVGAVAPGAVILGHSFGSIVVAAAVAGGLATPRVILVNPIGAPALEGPRGILTRLAVFYYWAGARLPAARRRRPAAQRRRRARHERLDGEDARRRAAPIHPRPARHVLLPVRRPRRAARRVRRVGLATTCARTRRRSSQPTLLVAAQRDDITPIEARAPPRDACSPTPTLVEIPDVGHLIHYETPAAAAEAIRRFLAPSAPGTR